MPASASNTIPMGRFTRLKKGAPTWMALPVKPSLKSGNRIPQMTANAMPNSIRLLNKNAASRERND